MLSMANSSQNEQIEQLTVSHKEELESTKQKHTEEMEQQRTNLIAAAKAKTRPKVQ